MPINAVNSSSRAQYSALPQNLEPHAIHSENRWQYAFVPKTSSWEGKPMCIDEFDEDQNCCVSGYDMEAVLEQAYEDGLEEHPGVKALKEQPCVSAMDLETLADELVHIAHKNNNRRRSQPIPGAPDFIDINEPTGFIPDRRIFRYCDELLHNTLSHSYGRLRSLPQKQKLGENFRAVVEYCSQVLIGDVRGRVPIFDVLTNNFIDEN